MVQTTDLGDRVVKNIKVPTIPYIQNYSVQADNLKKMTEKIKQSRTQNEQPIYTCSNREPGVDGSSFGQFIPVYVSDLTPTANTYTYTASKCFEKIDFTFEPVSQTQFNINVTTSGKRHLTCKEAFFFANTEIFHTEVFMFNAQHTLQFEMPDAATQADVNFGGMKVFEFCDGMVQEIESIWTSLQAFVGGLTTNPDLPIIGSHVPPYMEKANVEFLGEAMGYKLEARTTKKVEIDPDLI